MSSTSMNSVKKKGIEEAQRWRNVVKEGDTQQTKTLLKPDILIKVKATEYPESKYFVRGGTNVYKKMD